ncbi:TM2 domain-containing protein [Acidithiobacillus sp. CV18-2]|uniref:TM2 domain-containing protein n=1 Tax=Igneacidithiobacillus copahuensis TaxID=2724909 RepID=A0AAE2YRL5_9PROT|nr:TM2 domain-containing protein [Acidithiobacillus sp. CV18-3]MBU2758402.1 TM2 domain-containing protein [Acidithiobacillus sp. BN09-2]MBU2776718.1 TM2 domain-containing protein [Acidithiobacillus sp. CV18-2]MBU2788773.1 TM2 domain-containing protein [Igneacidithiobacillus copahuensis]MBU2799011.1 TM2 domain-containing protein [Acidithiobacillus sp. VAN18-4]UTV81577.1 TM2 domain-containing protein [Acidithiobacillus sp. YTS05]
MPKAWEKLDLKGEGLQSVQIRLQQLQKKTTTAYLTWLGFLLGLHRFYLQRPLAWAYPVASLVVVILALTLPWPFPLGLGVLILVAALIDLRHLGNWVSQHNREQRKAAWFAQQTPAAPKDFQGRPENLDAGQQWEKELREYRNVKESERAGHPAEPAATKKGFTAGSRRLSFAEQERLLAEISKKKKESDTERP